MAARFALTAARLQEGAVLAQTDTTAELSGLVWLFADGVTLERKADRHHGDVATILPTD